MSQTKANHSNFSNCWLTLNRQCNLRCKWCYAQDTDFKPTDDMNFSLACQIIDLCSEIGIKHITLIGGEPTLYNYLFDVIEYAKKKNIKTGIVTNGVKLSDKSFLMQLINAGISSISISLKGENKKAFYSICNVDAFDLVMNGIDNCSKANIPFSVSMVLTNENIPSFIDGLVEAQKRGAKSFHLSFCYEFNMDYCSTNLLSLMNVVELPKKFKSCYSSLKEKIKGKFSLFQTLPLCLWEKSFVDEMIKDNHVSSVCQLLRKTGLLFDTNGYLIPCNAMHKIKIGKINDDFNNGKTLLQYEDLKFVEKIYNKLRGVPSEECLHCNDLKNCGGGCVCQWTNFSFDDIRPFINKSFS